MIMKTTFLFVLPIAATLTFTSCSEHQDMNVDFGDRTYINDYHGVIDAIDSLSSTAEILSALHEIKEQTDANTEAMTQILEDIAYRNGIILPEEFPYKLLMTPAAYIGMQQDSWDMLNDLLELTVQQPITDQRIYQQWPDGTPTGHSCFRAEKTAESEDRVVCQPITRDGNMYYEFCKLKEWAEYTFTLGTGCTWAYMVMVQYNDAKGTREEPIYSTQRGGTWTGIRLYHIAENDGHITIMADPKASAWCSTSPVSPN